MRYADPSGTGHQNLSPPQAVLGGASARASGHAAFADTGWLTGARFRSADLTLGKTIMPNTVRLHRVLATRPEKVYRAFLEADALAKWLPPNGFACPVYHLEPKVGGTFKMSFRNFTTGEAHSFAGEYVELVQNERLRYTDKFDDPNPYPPTFERFEFLRWFRGVLVSGEVGVIKPDPRLFELLLERFAIDPKRAVYIDDVAANVDAARPFGIHTVHFTTPNALRAELAELGLLPSESTLPSR